MIVELIFYTHKKIEFVEFFDLFHQSEWQKSTLPETNLFPKHEWLQD